MVTSPVFQWSSAFSRATSTTACVSECVRGLELTEPPQVVFAFISEAFSEQYAEVVELLGKRFPKAKLLGCSASGLAGQGEEIEFRPGLSILAAVLPEVTVEGFYLNILPDFDGPPESWREIVSPRGCDVKGMVLLADPFSFDSRAALAGLDFAFPKAVKIGGLASGCRRLGEAALFLDQKIFSQGLVGLTFSGSIEILPVVAQGCQGFGKQYVITDSKANVIFELDGKPALDALTEMVEGLSQEDRAAYLATTIFVGLGAGGPSLHYQAGEFLVRQVLGTDPRIGAVAVGGAVRNGQTVQFHLRNRDTSKSDLHQAFERAKAHLPGHLHGALMFSCLGRGEGLYGELGHDSRVLQEKLGRVPASGFFCNGEFGPVGSQTCLHGFTSSFALFCRPNMEIDS